MKATLSNQNQSLMQSIRITVLSFALLGSLGLSACGNKNQNQNQNTPATTAGQSQIADVPAPECTQSGYNRAYGQAWQPYQNAGFVAYDWEAARRGYGGQYGGQYGTSGATQYYNSGCPIGYFPSCTSGVGLTCVPGTAYNNNQVAWYGAGANENSIRFCGYAGYSGEYVGTCGSYQQSFQQSFYPGAVGRTCQVGTNSCGYGVCQPVGYNSSIGVCVQ